MSQVNTVSALSNFLQVRKEEVGQSKDCIFQARLPHAEKPARKLDKWGYIPDINGR